MKLHLSRSKKEDTKNVLILEFALRSASFMFGLFNPILLFKRPIELRQWINGYSERIYNFKLCSGQIVCLYYNMWIPLRKSND